MKTNVALLDALHVQYLFVLQAAPDTFEHCLILQGLVYVGDLPSGIIPSTEFCIFKVIFSNYWSNRYLELKSMFFSLHIRRKFGSQAMCFLPQLQHQIWVFLENPRLLL